MLPLLGIVALLVAGLAVLLVALTYDESLARERRRQRMRRLSRATTALRRWSSATGLASSGPQVRRGTGTSPRVSTGPAREVARIRRAAVELGMRWRDHRHAARFEGRRWLALDSTGGQLFAGIVASLIVALLIVALV